MNLLAKSSRALPKRLRTDTEQPVPGPRGPGTARTDTAHSSTVITKSMRPILFWGRSKLIPDRLGTRHVVMQRTMVRYSVGELFWGGDTEAAYASSGR